MGEARNTYVIQENKELGSVTISDDVLAVISAIAALEVEGVHAMAGNITSEIVAKLGMKKLSKGVRVDVDGNNVMIDLSVILNVNTKVYKVSRLIQQKVKTAVENMTGLEVVNINVNVSNVSLD